ncbi:hypothetical protein DBR06_SOUSAS3110046, partial [Sousa chinensis]
TNKSIKSNSCLTSPASLWLSFLSPECLITARREPLCSPSVFRANEAGHRKKGLSGPCLDRLAQCTHPWLHSSSVESCSGLFAP